MSLFIRSLIGTGILVAAVMIALALAASKPDAATREESVVLPLVEVIALETFPAEFNVRSQGSVQPAIETTLSAEVSGSVVAAADNFVVGGVFREGDVLVRIDPSDYEASVSQAEALVRQRQIEYDGAKNLRAQGFRAEAEMAAAEASLAAAQADLKRARRNLERTEIRAPFAGILRDKMADIGQFVGPGAQVGTLFATDFAEVRLPLADDDLALIDLPDARDLATQQESTQNDVSLSAVRQGTEFQWDARIVRTENVVDEATRLLYAVARVEDPYRLQGDGEPLPIGTFVVATIGTQNQRPMIRIPRRILRGLDRLVFLDDNNQLAIRSVNVFRFDSDFAWIDDAELVGRRVVITTLENPINGLRVRVLGDTQATSAAGDDAP
ncbi:MAG: efflux RND transporter periplasmic adaptor subunit [Pseudomonadota bacterium]